jgi:hypothetical protein
MDSLSADAPHARRSAPVRGLLHAVDRLTSRRSLRAARRAADDELAARRRPPLRLAWRVEELVSTKSRLDHAHAFRSLVRDASPKYLPAAAPVNRVAVRAQADVVLEIAARIADLDRPVAARGVVLADRLLTEASSPLYDRDLVDELPDLLAVTLVALEPEPR